MRDLSDEHLRPAVQRGEDEVMPGEVLDRIMRYEAHLERQFERKLQQLVAWRRAKGEPAFPAGSDRQAGTAQEHASRAGHTQRMARHPGSAGKPVVQPSE